MTTQFEPLIAPALDPRNERQLTELAIDRIYTKSNYQINDFSPGNPTRALIEGQAFAGAELLFYANKLPEAFLIKFLQLAGIQRRLGAASQAIIQFQLQQALPNAFIVPANFPVYGRFATSQVQFRTNEMLVIPTGQTVGEVAATCTTLGSIGNVEAGALTRVGQPLAFLKSATNPDPASGGIDAETLNQVKLRGFQAIRRRSALVSATDYADLARTYLGPSAPVRVVPGVGDALLPMPSAVHIFGLAEDGGALNPAQIAGLQALLRDRSPLVAANRVFVSSLERVDVVVEAIAQILPTANPLLVARDIYERIGGYLSPASFAGPVVLVSEVEYRARRSAGLEFVRSIRLKIANSTLASTDIPLAHPWQVPNLLGAIVTLTTDTDSYAYALGESFGEDLQAF